MKRLIAIFFAGVVMAGLGGPSKVLAQGSDVDADAADHPDQDTVIVDPQTESIIREALKYIASQQKPDGGWNDSHRVAYTSYAMMAFMAAGELPGEGQYSTTLQKGESFLLHNVRPDGFIAAPSGDNNNMYDHGIASICLSELYGQTRDVNILPKLKLAIGLIIHAQNLQLGGWRYSPTSTDCDISVTVLQLVALRAAKNSGLYVPQTTIDRAVNFVSSCYDQQSGGFTYQPGNHQPGFARTAAAIYSLQVCGRYDDPHVKTGSTYVIAHKDEKEWFTYGSFYAAPAQYMIGGDTWTRWYTQIKGTLLGSMKRQNGMVYWQPLDSNPQSQNELYATCVYTEILALPYHYIPLYQR